MKKTILITIICILLFIHSIDAQCPAQLDLKNVQVGVFSLIDLNNNNPNASTQIISFKQYTLSLKNTLNDAKIIVALAEISVLSTGIDLFDINIISKTDTQFTLGFIYEPLKWNKVSYRYLVSNRTDLNFQMITLNQGSFKLSDNKNMIAETELDKPLQNFEKYEVLSFIRGIKYKNNDLMDHSFAVAITDQKLSSNKVQFTISSVTNSSNIQLQLLSLSYLYFQPNQAEFASFGGLIQKNDYVGKDQIDILHADLPSNLYLLYGITNIDITAKNFIISSSVTQDAFFSLQTSVSTKKIDFTYFSIGVKAADACSNCDLKIISGKSCVKECTSNEIFYQFKDGSKACQKCPDNQLSDSDHKLCVKSQTQVSQLSVNQLSENSSQNVSVQVNQTQNLTKSNIVATQYQQSQAYTPTNPNTKIQIQQIPLVNNQTVVQSINSVQSYSSENDQSQYYGPNQSTAYQPPIVSGQQQQTNGENSQYNYMTTQDISTIPNQQQYDEFNYCTTLTNSYWTGQSCQCKVGYKLYLASCVTIDEMQQNTDESSENINLNPPVNNNSIHHHISDLNPHPTAPNQQTNVTYEQPDCVSKFQVYNLTTQQCQCIEGLGYKADSVSNEYICVTCQDIQSFYLQNGRCQQCSTNQIYDKVNKTCICKQGFTLNSNNSCIQSILPQHPVIPTSQSTESPVQAPTNNSAALNQTQTANKNDTLKNTTSRTRDGQNRTPNNSTNTDNKDTQQNSSINSTNQTSTQSGSVIPTDIPIKNDSDTLKSVPEQTTVNSEIKNTTQNITSSTNKTASGTTVHQTIPSAQTIIPCMKLSKSPQINSANIYISLSLGVEQNFRSEDKMQSFIKQDFDKDALKPSSVYCIQSETQLKDFDCLLLYPTGVPNSNFSVNFWYDDNRTNTKCNLKVQVNPLQAATKSMRSLRRR